MLGNAYNVEKSKKRRSTDLQEKEISCDDEDGSHVLPSNRKRQRINKILKEREEMKEKPVGNDESSLLNLHCLLVYVISYGGGLVGGDDINIECILNENTNACLASQGSTKVFKAKNCSWQWCNENRDSKSVPSKTKKDETSGLILNNRVNNKMVLNMEKDKDIKRLDDFFSSSLYTKYRFHAHIKKGSTLLSLCDPVTCFKDSLFASRNAFTLEEGAGLVFVDSYTAGRMAYIKDKLLTGVEKERKESTAKYLKGIPHTKGSVQSFGKNGIEQDKYDANNQNESKEDHEVWAAQHIVSQVRVEISGEIIMIENLSLGTAKFQTQNTIVTTGKGKGILEQMCGYTCFGSIVIVSGHENLQPLLSWIKTMEGRDREKNIFSGNSFHGTETVKTSSSVLSSLACLRDPDVYLLRVCAKNREDMTRYFQEVLKPLSDIDSYRVNPYTASMRI